MNSSGELSRLSLSKSNEQSYNNIQINKKCENDNISIINDIFPNKFSDIKLENLKWLEYCRKPYYTKIKDKSNITTLTINTIHISLIILCIITLIILIILTNYTTISMYIYSSVSLIILTIIVIVPIIYK